MNRANTTQERLTERVEVSEYASIDLRDRLADAKLSDRIHDAFHHSQGLSECDIAIATSPAEVVLSGTVRLSLQKRLADVIVRRFGITNVTTSIVVTGRTTAS